MNSNDLIQRIRRYTVYDWTLAFLILLAANFVYTSGLNVLAQILVVTLTATVLDEVIVYYKSKKLFLPKSAIITGLIISLLIFSELLWIQVFVPALAIVLKHLIRHKRKPIFNLAALALVISFLLFKTNISWIGVATPLAFFGLLIAYKLRRLTSAISFLAIYYIINLILSTHHLPKIFFPDAVTVFFATIMLIEPRTSPQSKYRMVIFAVVAALLANLFTHFGSPVDSLLLALLVANLLTILLNKVLIK